MSSTSPLLKLTDVSLSFGDKPLLDHVDLDIFKGERICLVGRNGVGKSSLLRVITGQNTLDDGELWQKSSLRIAYLEQTVPTGENVTVFEVVSSGLAELGDTINHYH